MDDRASGVVLTTNDAGPISVVPAEILIAEPETAWHYIQDLHLLAVDESPRSQIWDGFDLQRETAAGMYDDAVASVFAQLAVTGPGANATALESITDFADANGSFDGLEGVFLSAAVGTQRADPGHPALARATDVMQRLGLPQTVGGGATQISIIDPSSGQFAFPDRQRADHAFQEAVAASSGSGRPMDYAHLFSNVVGTVDAETGRSVDAFLESRAGHVVSGVAEIGTGVAMLAGGPVGVAVGIFSIIKGIVDVVTGVTHQDRPAADRPEAGGHASPAPSTSTAPAAGPHTTGTHGGHSSEEESRSFKRVILGKGPEHSDEGVDSISPTGPDGEGYEFISPVGPDGEEGPADFGPPGTRPTPMAMLTGAGLLSLIALDDAGGVTVQGLPTVDDSGALLDNGFLATLDEAYLTEQLAGLEPGAGDLDTPAYDTLDDAAVESIVHSTDETLSDTPAEGTDDGTATLEAAPATEAPLEHSAPTEAELAAQQEEMLNPYG